MPHENGYMDYQEIVGLVMEWSCDHGLAEADPKKQMLVLMEEAGALAGAIAHDRGLASEALIGCVLVVMTILCQQLSLDMEECFRIAYEQMKSMENG